MAESAYRSLASVYDWLVPDQLATPDGNLAAYEAVTSRLRPGARVLDASCGIGLLAVGLARAGFRVTACDASADMVDRTRALADEHGVAFPTAVCRWDQLAEQGWDAQFDAVFCVGNSLAHAEGRTGRLASLQGMAAVLGHGGLLALTSRNWERVRADGDRLDVWDRLVERDGRRGLVVYSWRIPPSWEAEHHLRISVAVLGDQPEDRRVQVTTETLSMWPFHHESLLTDLATAGLDAVGSTYEPEVAQYLVTARRAPRLPAGDG